MADNQKTLGEIVDQVADSYFARGCDSFTANLYALRDVQLILMTSLDRLSSILQKLASNQEVSGNE